MSDKEYLIKSGNIFNQIKLYNEKDSDFVKETIDYFNKNYCTKTGDIKVPQFAYNYLKKSLDYLKSTYPEWKEVNNEKWLGKFTGKIYNEDDNYNSECCILLSDHEVDNIDFINRLKVKNKLDCINCHECPASNM